MAIITVRRREADGKSFPQTCMRCGAESDRLVLHTFSWMPWWVYLCFFAGILPFLIVILLSRKTMRVNVPLCKRHVNHWRNRSFYTWIGLMWWLGMIIVLVMLARVLPEEIFTLAIGVCLFGALIWFIGLLILGNGTILALEIRKFGMDIENVNEQFAEEWRKYCVEVDGQPISEE